MREGIRNKLGRRKGEKEGVSGEGRKAASEWRSRRFEGRKGWLGGSDLSNEGARETGERGSRRDGERAMRRASAQRREG